VVGGSEVEIEPDQSGDSKKAQEEGCLREGKTKSANQSTRQLKNYHKILINFALLLYIEMQRIDGRSIPEKITVHPCREYTVLWPC
jgi:hypothetical protein